MTTCNECHGQGCEVCNDRGWIPSGELRLHLADDNTIGCHDRGLSHKIVDGKCEDCGYQQSADITLALKHHTELNKDAHTWASLECVVFPHTRDVKLHIGSRHPEPYGKEIARSTRHYYLKADGKATYYVAVHP